MGKVKYIKVAESTLKRLRDADAEYQKLLSLDKDFEKRVKEESDKNIESMRVDMLERTNHYKDQIEELKESHKKEIEELINKYSNGDADDSQTIIELTNQNNELLDTIEQMKLDISRDEQSKDVIRTLKEKIKKLEDANDYLIDNKVDNTLNGEIVVTKAQIEAIGAAVNRIGLDDIIELSINESEYVVRLSNNKINNNISSNSYNDTFKFDNEIEPE